jgi:thioesterase domain-containing protein
MEQGTSLVTDLLSRDSRELKTKCGLTRLKESMNDEEAEALGRAIELVKSDNSIGKAKVYSSQWLTEVLNKHGHFISSSTIARHISGRCNCE